MSSLAKKYTDKAEEATSRSGMYGFLSSVYKDVPTAEFLTEIKNSGIVQMLSGAGVNIGIDEDITELEVEYTRIFMGPGKHIPPFESVHVEGSDGNLFGKASVEVRDFIESLDVKLSGDQLPDHIGTELEFMQMLTQWESQCWAEGDSKAAKKCIEAQKAFINHHLALWIPAFTEKVAESAELPFYKEIAQLTNDFIVAEQE